jgi:hypothetical protein
MPYNGSGSFNYTANSVQPAVDDTTIDSSDFNDSMTELETALSSVICLDGQSTTSAAIPFGQGIETDTIAEASANSGVTVDSVLLKDGGIALGTAGTVVFEGATADAFETTLTVTDPTADRTITFPDETGTVVLASSDSAFSGDNTFSGTNTFNGAVTLNGGITGPGFSMINGSLAASVGSSALTIAIKGNNGSDPSATNAVNVLIRNATAATGTYTNLALTAATSLVISSGSKVGASNGTAFRLWIIGFNDGGTFRLGAINCLSGTSIYPLGQFPIASSTAEGGAGAADSAQVFYTGTAVTSKAYVVLGYAEWASGLTTAGTWDAAPTRLELFGPHTPLPGAVIQRQRTQTGTANTGTTVMVQDDTIPQNTEGDQYMSQAITPASAANLLDIESRAILASSATSNIIVMALFQDSGADALAMTIDYESSSQMKTLSLSHARLAGTTSAATFKIRAGGTGAGTTTFNGLASLRKFGGVCGSFLEAREIMA